MSVLPNRRPTPGFTLVELLVAIGIIGILIALLMSTAGQALEAGRRTNCLANTRSLALGWMAYTNDNRGVLVSAHTATGAWTTAGNADENIRKGLLFKYCPDLRAYACPSDPNRVVLRSYSMNALLNGEGASGVVFRNRREIKDPSRTFIFVEEQDPRGYNLGSFIVYKSGDQWCDWPAKWHGRGSTLSFADGHSEFWNWDDPRTLAITAFHTSTADNPDLKRLQAVAGY